jgi:hypothetical protein
MAPCSNHASSKKVGTCHSCGFCKLCPPLTDGSCKTPDDHIQPGKQNKQKQQNPSQKSNITATPSRESRNAEVNYTIESFDDEKCVPSLNRTKAYPNSSHESRQIHDKVPTASSMSSLSQKRKLVDICTTLGLSQTLRHDLAEATAESDGFIRPQHIAADCASRTYRRAKRIRTCILEAIDELICPQEPRACANTQLAQQQDLSLDDDELDNRKKIAVVESINASNTTSMVTKSTFETTCTNDDAKYPVQCHWTNQGNCSMQ